MAEELLVTLNRSESTGFGFSLLGTAGLPHVIYDIVENSPAADSGKVRLPIRLPKNMQLYLPNIDPSRVCLIYSACTFWLYPDKMIATAPR